METWMRTFATTLLVCALGLSLTAQDKSAEQSMKDAGHETKNAAKDIGHGTATAAKKTGHATKETTKKVLHKGAQKTEKGATKVENKTAPQWLVRLSPYRWEPPDLSGGRKPLS
jgi:hypothetical protein